MNMMEYEMTDEDIYQTFMEIGMFTMIEGGILNGQLADETEGVYWIRQLIKRFEEREEYEKCHELHTMLQLYIKAMKLDLT